MSSDISLITVDIGGTLGTANGPGLAMRLAAASPLPAAQARAIMRGRLHTQPEITAEIVAGLGLAAVTLAPSSTTGLAT